MPTNDMTVDAVIKTTQAPIQITFPEFPDDCECIRFVSAEQSFELNADEVVHDALTVISNLAQAFKHDDNDELRIAISDDYDLCIDMDGDHIRFVSDGEEVKYWVCDEFEEPSEIVNVLGAIAGAMVSQDAVFES